MKKIVILDIETVPYTEAASLWKPKDDKQFPPIYVHKICCICLMEIKYSVIFNRVKIKTTKLITDCRGEESILKDFNNIMTKNDYNEVVTFNGDGFDWQVINHRLYHYGLDASWYYSKRFKNANVDLMTTFTENGKSRIGLNALSILANLPGKNGKGSCVKSLYDEEKFTEISDYCMNDVVQTAMAYIRYKKVRGDLSSKMYYDIVDKINGKSYDWP